jgi:hypothetical protein
VVDLLWHVGGGMFFYLPSQTRQFSKLQFPMRVWILDFLIHPKSLPIAKIHPIANLLSSKLLQWTLENPQISQVPKSSPNSPKNLPIANPVAKVQKISNLKGTVIGQLLLF